MSACAAALVLPPLLLAAILVAARLRRPRVMTEPTKPALIVAAHPDDCVILAGGYGIRAREEGRQVQVVYLTCGAEAPGLPRAQIRKQEALNAWGLIGVPAADVTFLDRPEHGVDAQFSWAEEDRDAVVARLEELLRAMPADGMVFVPAAGEAHVDHRALRRVTLEAWQRSGRADLTVMEGPEYNGYLSLLQSPRKVFQVLATGIPGLSRLADRGRPAWTGFAGGGPYWTLPPSETGQARRQELLRAFTSENGELLVKLFGWFERYRPVKDPERGFADEPPRGYVMLGGRRRGFSALLLLLVLAEIAALAAGAGAGWLRQGAGGATWVRAAVVIVAAGAFVMGARRRAVVDTRAFYWGLAAGALVGVLR